MDLPFCEPGWACIDSSGFFERKLLKRSVIHLNAIIIPTSGWEAVNFPKNDHSIWYKPESHGIPDGILKITKVRKKHVIE